MPNIIGDYSSTLQSKVMKFVGYMKDTTLTSTSQRIPTGYFTYESAISDLAKVGFSSYNPNT